MIFKSTLSIYIYDIHVLLHLERKRTKKEQHRRYFQKQNIVLLLSAEETTHPHHDMDQNIPNYFSVQMEPSKLPRRHFCSVCG